MTSGSEGNRNKTIKTKKVFASDSVHRKILMFIILFFVGVIISVQIKAIEESKERLESTKANVAYYNSLLKTEKEYTEITTQELQLLRDRKNELLEQALKDSGYTAIFESLRSIYQLAGFTEIKGPGVIVTLDDQLSDDPKYPANSSAIHDTDIRHVIDVMRSGGAYAISVNGERVVNTSELTCNGPTVQINKKKYPVPYVITCVGDPMIISSLLEHDEYLQGRIISNIEFRMETTQSAVVPAFDDYDRIAQYIDALKGGTDK